MVVENDLAGETQPEEEEEQELVMYGPSGSKRERDGLEFSEPAKEARGEKNSSSSSPSERKSAS